MSRLSLGMSLVVALALAAGCKRESVPKKQPTNADKPAHDARKQTDDGHEHAAGGGHHDEVDLGVVTIGDMQVSLAQGHGKVEAGKEGHLVVKLPYNDKGATVVRAWIGTADRTASLVGKGTYAPSHDDYDVHATAPDPLPDDVMWWVEIEKPDGTTVTGSVKPLLD